MRLKTNLKVIILLLALTGALMLSLVGCASHIAAPSPNPIQSISPEAREIVSKTISAMSNVNTFTLDSKVANTFTVYSKNAGDAAPIPASPTTVWSGHRVVDLSQHKLHLNMDIETGATPYIFERYLIDGNVYFKTTSPVVYQGGLPISPWITNQNDFMWAEAIQIPQQIALMQTAADASLAGSEKVDGVDCYVLDITPSYGAMADWILSQDQHKGPSLGSSFGGPTLSGKDAFMKFNKGSSARFWISQDNYLILKSEEGGAFSATDQELGLNPTTSSWSKITSTFNGTLVFSNYNQPVDIRPPTEAELNPTTPPPPPPTIDETQLVTFKDPNLEQAVRQAINKPQGDILVGDVDNLLNFQAINSGIKDLSGLEYFTKLNVLMLDGNEISDIPQLAKLQKLGLIHLENNQISDISALSSIWNPLILDLSGNRISDLSPLKSLNSLGTLDLDHNQVSDISPLLEMVELKSLSLEDNPLNADSLNKYIPQLKAKGIAVGQ